jgi:hypothetical protein
MWLSCSLLALLLEESARLQTEAMRLSTPMFMERDEAEDRQTCFHADLRRTRMGPFCREIRGLSRLGYPDSDYPGGRSSYGQQ